MSTCWTNSNNINDKNNNIFTNSIINSNEVNNSGFNNLFRDMTSSMSIDDNSDKEDDFQSLPFDKYFPDLNINAEIYSLALYKDNKTLIIGNGNNEDIVIDINEKKIIETHHCYKESVAFVIFSKDFKYLLSASLDGFIVIYKVNSNKILKQLSTIKHEKDEEIAWVEWNPKGPMFSYGCIEGNVYIYLAESLNKFITIKSYSESTCGKFTHEGTGLITCYIDGICKLFDIKNNQLKKVIKSEIGGIYCMALSDKKNLFVVGSTDNEIQFISYEKECVVFYQKFFTEDDEDKSFSNDSEDEHCRIDSIDFCNDGNLCVFSDRQSHFKIFDMKFLQVNTDFSLDEENITKICHLNFKTYIVLAAGTNGNIYIFDTSNKPKMITKIKMHTDTVYDLIISNDDKFFISGSLDCTVNYKEIKEYIDK